jgi:arsenate reductase (glutaredoxin)
MTYILYGIPNCDTIKKAKNWLDKNGVAYTFHNYKTDGISASKIEQWLTQVPLSKLVNKASTTFRSLSDADKERINDASFAIKLMQEQSSIIKRPVLELDENVITVGFKAALYETLLIQK